MFLCVFTNSTAVISDEVYRVINYTEEKYVSIAHYLPNQTFIVGGASKEVAGTGVRFAFVAGPGTTILTPDEW